MGLKQRILGLALALSLAVGLCAPAQAATDSPAGSYDRAAAYVTSAVPAPQVGSIGGEWAVLGLAEGGAAVPAGYFDGYYARVEQYVREKDGVLHTRKYTEYSRVILAVTALGKDARSVAGYDLTRPLGDYDKTVWQGLNGPVWALIALDSGDYPVPENPDAATQATRQMYVEHILSRQLADGGWSTGGTGSADADMTAMALQALAGYTGQDAVQGAVERGLGYLSAQQQEDGGFSSGGVKNAESCAQVVSALCALGLSVTDERFVKNGNTVVDALLTYQLSGGGFCHVQGGEVNQMATEQALCALARLKESESAAVGASVPLAAVWTAVLAALLAARMGR